jgi:iron complex outermembrane receptor protein
VLVDGRSVYSPNFGGVFWETQDIPLENIERVEVIRGPGGTLWGANAVNGVINIITKSSDRSQGVSVSSSSDIGTGYTALVQYGGRMGGNLTYRVYGKASYWEPLNSSSGIPLPNSYGVPQAGMRVDWTASAEDSISMEGTEIDGRHQGFTLLANPVVQSKLLKDTNFSIRWKHRISERSSAESFAYCDWFSNQDFPEERENSCYIELQNDFEFNARNSLIWGGSFQTTGDASVDLQPEYRRFNLESGFFQYEYVAIPGHLRLLGGSKFDGNPFSGIEFQPQARAVWTINQAHSLWGSFSRAVRPPSHSEVDLNVVTAVVPSPGGPITFRALGNSALESEHLKAFELGYRFQPSATFSFDLACYYNSYDDLIGLVRSPVQPPSEVVTIFNNETASTDGTAQTHGAEFTANWQALRRWRISPSFTETRGSSNAMENVPRHLFAVQSRLDLPRRTYVDAGLYHYNALAPSPGAILGAPPVPGVPTFNRIDVGMSWRPGPNWTLGVWGRNLQSDKHLEFTNDFFGGTAGEIPRSVSFKLMWQSNPGSK